MRKELLVLIGYHERGYSVEEHSLILSSLDSIILGDMDLEEEKRKQRIKEGYKVTIIWNHYLSHRSIEENQIVLKTPDKIENQLSKLEWEFDLAEAIMARYGIRPSQVVQ